MDVIGLVVIFIGVLIIGIPLIIGIYFFIKIKGWCAVVSVIFITVFIQMLVLYEIESMKNDIRYKSMLKFGVEPQYIDINFDILSAGKRPHSQVSKDGKVYYWSFTKNDFVFYHTYQANKWQKTTPENIDKLLKKYIFNERSN